MLFECMVQKRKCHRGEGKLLPIHGETELATGHVIRSKCAPT